MFSLGRQFYHSTQYIQNLHYFCNTLSPDDGQKLGRKYFGNN